MCQRDSGFGLSRAAVCGHGPALREMFALPGRGGRACVSACASSRGQRGVE